MNNAKVEIYSKIFDIVETNMINSCGKGFEYTKDAFIATVTSDVGEADIFRLSKLDNISFIQASYASFLFRTADEGALKKWRTRAEQEPNNIKEALVKSVLRSEEFAMKGALVKNNIYSSADFLSPKISIPTAKSSELNGNTDKAINKLYRIYKKLPRPIRNIIRKFAGLQ